MICFIYLYLLSRLLVLLVRVLTPSFTFPSFEADLKEILDRGYSADLGDGGPLDSVANLEAGSRLKVGMSLLAVFMVLLFSCFLF
jgi:hypothetical protein